MNIITEYNNFKTNTSRVEKFTTSSLTKGKRLSKLNTNLKTLETYYKYAKDISTILEYTDDAVKEQDKQKNSFLSQRYFRYVGCEDPIFISRSNILVKSGDYFDKDSIYTKIITLMLILRESNESGNSFLLQNAKEFIDLLSNDCITNMFHYISNLNDISDGKNKLFNSMVFYGDLDLLKAYTLDINSNVDLTPFEIVFKNDLSKKSTPIGKRVSTLQQSSLKEEVRYVYILMNLINMVDSLSIYSISMDISKYDFLNCLIDVLHVSDSISKLGNRNGKSKEDFSNFILNPNNDCSFLSSYERDILIDSIAFAFKIKNR